MILVIMAIELGCCDASHMHYPQHFCVVLLRQPYEKAEGCHLLITRILKHVKQICATNYKFMTQL